MTHDPHFEERSTPRVSSDEERERVIREVLRHRQEKEEALEFQSLQWTEEQRRRGLGIRHAVFAVALLVSLYLWSDAAWWARMPPPAPPTTEHLTASLRLALYLQAQQVENFRRETGRLPDDLSEAGGAFPGIRYFSTPRGTYHLEAVTDRATLFYASSLAETPEEFLGAAQGRILPRPFWEGAP